MKEPKYRVVCFNREMSHVVPARTKREARSIAYQYAARQRSGRPVWCEPSAWPTEDTAVVGGYDASGDGHVGATVELV